MYSITFHHQFYPLTFSGDDLFKLDKVAWSWRDRLSAEAARPSIRKPRLHPVDADVAVEMSEEFDPRMMPYIVSIYVVGKLNCLDSAVHRAWSRLPLERDGRSLSEIHVERLAFNAFRVKATYLGPP